MDTIQVIGIICLTVAGLLELLSYYKQIAKTLYTGKSAHVSSSAFVYKIVKYIVTIIGLIIYMNWAAVTVEVAALIFCSIALWVIYKAKPKGWRLFSWMNPKTQNDIILPSYLERKMGKKGKLRSKNGRLMGKYTRKK